jgi:hypothetical protein
MAVKNQRPQGWKHRPAGPKAWPSNSWHVKPPSARRALAIAAMKPDPEGRPLTTSIGERCNLVVSPSSGAERP